MLRHRVSGYGEQKLGCGCREVGGNFSSDQLIKSYLSLILHFIIIYDWNCGPSFTYFSKFHLS